MKNEPRIPSDSCAASRPELDAISTDPSPASSSGTSTLKGKEGTSPFAPVQPPPLQASMIPTRTVARSLSSRERSTS